MTTGGDEVLARLVPEDPDGHVVSLVLDRPSRRNAVSTAMARQVCDLTEDLAGRESLRAVVLRSSSGTFCAGADLRERAGMGTAGLIGLREAHRACYRGVLELPVPVVAAVVGYALGGGCELALSSDLVVGGHGTVLALPEVGLGLVPGGGGTQLAVRRLGAGRAADLVLTGRRVDAGEAYRIGLLDRLVADDQVVAEALALARLVARQSPTAVRAARRAMRVGADLPLADGLDVEDAAWREVVAAPDRQEGVDAFVAGRAPRWSDPHAPTGAAGQADRAPASD